MALDMTLSASKVLFTLVDVFLAWWVYRLVYNAFFHPLAKFPGPKLAAATRWYEGFFDIVVQPGGQYMYEIRRAHENYGPIVRIGPNEVHVNDPEFSHVLYAPGVKRDKVPFIAGIFGVPLAMFGTISHDLHRSRRRALNPFFSRSTVQKLDGLMRAKVTKMCDAFHDHYGAGKVFQIRHAMTSYIVDITTEYSFRKCANALDDENFSPLWWMMVAGGSEYSPIAKQFPDMLLLIQKLPLWVIRMMSPLMTAYAEFELKIRSDVTEIFEQYKTGTLECSKPSREGVSTVFHEILESSLSEDEKTIDRMTQEAVQIIAAAGDTTSNTASTMVYFLAANPSYARRLHEELKTVMPDSTKQATWRELEQLPFLGAVIKEGLRITAPIAGRLGVMAPEPLQYKQWSIPAGTYIGMSPGDHLCNPDVFASPSQFLPDRWLDASPAELKKMETAFMPFGRGPRMCIGYHLAHANLYHLLAGIFRRFEIELVDTVRNRDIDTMRDCFVAKPSKESHGIKMRIVREY